MHYHRDITRILATHRCSTGTRIDQCTDYRISYYCYRYVMFTYHCYTCMSCFHIPVTHACMVSLFLSYGFPFILHVFHVTVFMLYDCFLLLIWIFPLLDMRAVDMRYVESHSYCSRFRLYCSCYIVPISRYIVLCYQQSSGPVIMLPVSCTVVVLVALYT